MPQMLQVLRERLVGMLTAGMSTRAVARELNVHFSTIIHLQRCFREFGSTSDRPHNHRPHVTTSAQDLHIKHLHLQDSLRPATRTAAATIGLYNQRISAQTVRNSLSHSSTTITLLRRKLLLYASNITTTTGNHAHKYQYRQNSAKMQLLPKHWELLVTPTVQLLPDALHGQPSPVC